MKRTALPALTALLTLTAPAAAQSTDRIEAGRSEYVNNCASCHGMEARGDGPVAALLNIDVPDLTQLSARNDGTFPFERVYRTIDGRAQVQAHGTREMPVWGSSFRAEALTNTNPFIDSANAEMFVAGRILALITYLSEIQE